jgi:hypothetical protein
MARQHFSLRTPHQELWTPIDQDYAEYFLDELEKAKRKYPLNRIFNFDETCCKRYPGPPKVFAEKRSEAVKLKRGKGEKENDGDMVASPPRERPFHSVSLPKNYLMSGHIERST